MTIVVGVDPSLSSTGVFAIVDGESAHERVQSKPGQDSVTERALRIATMCAALHVAVRNCSDRAGGDGELPALIVMEAPSYGSQMQGQSHYLAGLWWGMARRLSRIAPLAVAAPGTVKKFATGSGRAGKDEMLAAAIRAFPEARISNNDVADAAALAGLGAAYMNVPAGRWPGKGRDAVLAVRWPSISKGEK